MQRFIRLAVLIVLAFTAFAAAAQDKPAWVIKGTNSLNRSRSNDTYELRMFNTWGIDKGRLEEGYLSPLKAYLRAECDAAAKDMTTDSVATNDGIMYEISYVDKNNGERHTVKAIRVDYYIEYADYEENDYRWEFYQLYAISRPDVQPKFDEFEITRSYNALATSMSIVPGWGQLYKGQYAKAGVIMGLEAVSIVGIGIAEHKRHYMMKEAALPDTPYDSWRGKANSWRNVRNLCIGIAAATYIYNIIDAATSKGPTRVIVHKRKKADSKLMVAPTYMPEGGAGMAFALTF